MSNIPVVYNNAWTNLGAFVQSPSGTYTQAYPDAAACIAAGNSNAYIILTMHAQPNIGMPTDTAVATYSNCIGTAIRVAINPQGTGILLFSYIVVIPLEGYDGVSQNIVVVATGVNAANCRLSDEGGSAITVYNVDPALNPSLSAIAATLVNVSGGISTSQAPIPCAFTGLNYNDLIICVGVDNTTGGSLAHPLSPATGYVDAVGLPPDGSYGSHPSGESKASFAIASSSTLTYYWSNPFWHGNLFNEYTDVAQYGIRIVSSNVSARGAWPPVILSNLTGAVPRIWPIEDDITARSPRARITQ